MFFRGINYHGQKSIDKKKRILNEYVQNLPSVNMIFLVGVSFIETPVFQFSPKDKIGSSLNENKNSTGLLDYGFPFTVQKIGGKIFTKIEACWYKILMDFFNAEPIKLTYLGYDWFEGSNYNFSDKELENLRKMNKTIINKK